MSDISDSSQYHQLSKPDQTLLQYAAELILKRGRRGGAIRINPSSILHLCGTLATKPAALGALRSIGLSTLEQVYGQFHAVPDELDDDVVQQSNKTCSEDEIRNTLRQLYAIDDTMIERNGSIRRS